MLSGCQFLGNALGFHCRGFGAALFEFLNRTGGVQKVLLAGIERVAIGTNFNMKLLFGGTGGEYVAAGADNLGISKICWVEIFFHPV